MKQTSAKFKILLLEAKLNIVMTQYPLKFLCSIAFNLVILLIRFSDEDPSIQFLGLLSLTRSLFSSRHPSHFPIPTFVLSHTEASPSPSHDPLFPDLIGNDIKDQIW